MYNDNLLINSRYYKIWKEHIHLSQSSIYTYTQEFKKFGLFLEASSFTGDLDFDKFYCYPDSNAYDPIDESFIDQYIFFLKNELNSSKHIVYDNIVYLKNFFAFLKSINLIQRDPISHYRNGLFERKIINRSLTEDEAIKMLHASIRLDPFLRQPYVLLLLLLTTGLRNSELRNLTKNQIDFDRNVIYVDKGQKNGANSVYITDRLSIEFKRYLEHPTFKEWEMSGNQTLFFDSNKTVFNTREKLNNLLKEISVLAGISSVVTVHSLRHTMAYLMQKSGIPLPVIQRQLRHKNISTTLRYLPPLEGFNSILDDNN